MPSGPTNEAFLKGQNIMAQAGMGKRSRCSSKGLGTRGHFSDRSVLYPASRIANTLVL